VTVRKDSLARRVLKGDRGAVARAITLAENGEIGSKFLEEIRPSLGRSFILGLTGPPGTGKSTLVDRLIAEYRKRRIKVGVIAVDPTSPISGGALLGDRIRMVRHTLDGGVFIRSMASRGWSGGLSGAVSEVIQVLDASGVEVVIIETVGIGQSDIEIMKIAHAVVVVTMPGLGDDVQVSKAGLMEIGDVYAVNKSDLPGADAMVINLLSVVRDMKGRSPPVLKVSALKGEGVSLLFEDIERLRGRFLSPEGREMRLRSVRGMIVELAKKRLLSDFEGRAVARAAELAVRVADRDMTYERAAETLVKSEKRH
jgi:GTPase